MDARIFAIGLLLAVAALFAGYLLMKRIDTLINALKDVAKRLGEVFGQADTQHDGLAMRLDELEKIVPTVASLASAVAATNQQFVSPPPAEMPQRIRLEPVTPLRKTWETSSSSAAPKDAGGLSAGRLLIGAVFVAIIVAIAYFAMKSPGNAEKSAKPPIAIGATSEADKILQGDQAHVQSTTVPDCSVCKIKKLVDQPHYSDKDEHGPEGWRGVICEGCEGCTVDCNADTPGCMPPANSHCVPVTAP